MSKNRNQNTPNQLAPGSSPGSGGGEKTKSNASCKQQVAHEDKPPMWRTATQSIVGRSKACEAVASGPTTGDVLDLLVRTGWLPEASAGDRKAVGLATNS